MSNSTNDQKLLTLTIKDKENLYTAYMGFIKNGALFVPSVKKFHLSEPVFVLLSFADSGERHSVAGRVVWITPQGAPKKRPQGVGIQFQPPEAAELQKKIEATLAGHDDTQATSTL
ncbi:MAG: PilZ domain-containing protein [Nitrosospira sp.]|nr:PilZ domain-containing protein [Nitrosospira sp.]